ncbi:MAG: 3-deoxy-D-manno-octulosonic acid kinase [Gammaproteobacteria bacterium]
MTPQTVRQGKHYLLYDADQIEPLDVRAFDPEWHARSGGLRGAAEGRGTTHFVTMDGIPAVLRHYHRGGLVAKIVKDRYLRNGLESSRPWCEWNLLARLHALQLPVPRPIAAHVEMSWISYRGDLLTGEIIDARPLSRLLVGQSPDLVLWRRIGGTIRRFHRAGVWHADLNAHNILLDSAGEVFVIDFDRGRVIGPDEARLQSNLARLKRSLDKLSRLVPDFRFKESDWNELLLGYRED